MRELSNGEIWLDSDEEVKELLVLLGKWGDITKHPVYNHVFGVLDTPGALIAVSYSYDFPDPQDNGYVALILKKDRFCPLEAARRISEFHDGMSLDPNGPKDEMQPGTPAFN